MSGLMSCCGVDCAACQYYPRDCAGCREIQGRVFWTQYTGDRVCPIYACCVTEKGLRHCGGCGELPCGRYDQEDPTISHEENRRAHALQMENLRRMAAEDAAGT